MHSTEERGAKVRKSKKHAALVIEECGIGTYDEKARKKEKDIATAAAVGDLGIDNDNDKKPKKKKRKQVSEEKSSEVISVKGEKKKRYKKSTEEPAVEEKTEYRLEEEAGHERKKRKKRKLSSDDAMDTVQTSSMPSDGSGKSVPSGVTTAATGGMTDGKAKKSKKRNGNSKIIDPNEDKSLSEQALKALSYAFSQYQNPTEWKFNKARQNWLIRNIWSPVMIPDNHLPLLVRYLKNVKGGVRDTLIKTCQTHLQQPEVQTEDRKVVGGQAESEATPTPLFGLSVEALGKPSDKTQEIKKLRAEVVLETLEVL